MDKIKEVAENMINKYKKEKPEDVAADYRHMYDRGTFGWNYWDKVIEQIKLIKSRRIVK